MLCDDLIRRARSRHGGHPVELAFLKKVADLIEQAERFVLDREAIDVILNVEDSKPTSLIAGLNVCRLPFPIMWVEYDLLYRMKQQTARYGYPPEYPPDAKEIQGGMLIIASDDTMRRGMAYSGSRSSKEKNTPIINPVQYLFDWFPPGTNENIPINQRMYELWYSPLHSIAIFPPKGGRLTDNRYTGKIRHMPNEVEALVNIEEMYRYTCDLPEARRYLQMLEASTQGQRFRDLTKQLCGDWAGEKRWMLGLMLLLNTRNLVELENRSVFTQNRHRSPRVLPALVSHRIVKIKLSRVSENRMNAQGIPQSKKAFHRVRGHWKVRKTGVFFWHAHTRGDMTKGVIQHEYHVTK